MTTEEKTKRPCQWFHKTNDRTMCWISHRDIDESEITKYCVSDWQDCEVFPNPEEDDSCDSC